MILPPHGFIVKSALAGTKKNRPKPVVGCVAGAGRRPAPTKRCLARTAADAETLGSVSRLQWNHAETGVPPSCGTK
jgi:hypothetical protein